MLPLLLAGLQVRLVELLLLQCPGKCMPGSLIPSQLHFPLLLSLSLDMVGTTNRHRHPFQE